MNIIRKFAASLFLALLIASAPLFAKAGEDPAGCIEEIGIAVGASDVDAFQELVDVDGILRKSLNTLVTEAQKPENAALLPPVASMLVQQLSTPGMTGEGLRSLIVSEMRSFVLNGIASGAFAGKQVSGAPTQGMLAPLFANASMGKKEIQSIGQARQDGQDWLVPFVVHDFGNGQNYAIIGRLVTSDNGLKLAEIDNLLELLAKIGNESLEQGVRQ